MTAASVLRAWNRFFFEPQRPTPVALYRIIYGVMNLANLMLLRPDWMTWYGPHATLSIATMHQLLPGPRLNILSILPQTDAVINGYFWVFVFFLIMLTIGFMTRLSTIAVYVLLASMHTRNIYILNSGDTLLRVTGFFLMFAPAGAALSVDRLLRIWRGREGVALPLASPWAQRMIQIETAMVYISTCWWKTLGHKWLDGTAVYYALQTREIQRFPVPGLTNPLFMKLATWGTLAIEFSAGTLVWFREFRYPILLAALSLHIGIEYSMNLPLFEWITVGTYVTFIYPEDLTRLWARVRERWGPRLSGVFEVIYDSAAPASLQAANVLRVIDVFERLRFIDARSPDASTIVSQDALTRGRILIATAAGLRTGLAGLRTIARAVPLLWPLALLTPLSRSAKPVASAPSLPR